jgi:hypothetical protein
LASVKCLPLKNMEATIVLAANSPSMVQPLLCHSSQSIPAMRGTDCEREESSRELRNVYRSNLASGLELRLPIIPAGTSVLLCIFCCMM